MTCSARRGFTLVELLVTITIVITLAGIIFSVTRKVRQSALASGRLADMRQSGTLLLGIASENNGRCSYFAGGNSAWNFRPYLMIRNQLGLTGDGIVEIMHWDSGILPPDSMHWTCRAVNFQNVTHPDGTTTKWTLESVKNSDGSSANLKSISLVSVAKPGSYPLLIDSSSASGKEIFRISENTGDCVGLRESGKANAFLFDGSARLMDKSDLKNAGFKKAYDNSKTPPVSVNL